MTGDRSSENAIRRCEHIKRFLFLLSRFPAFSSEFIREHIDKPDTEPSELEDYKANCVTSKRLSSVFLVCLYVAWTLKNSYIVHVWLAALDYDNYANNVREVPASRSEWLNYSAKGVALRRVSCLLTNCTRLGPLALDYENPFGEHTAERLVEDVSRLPLASLCASPWLGQLVQRPVMALGALGLLIHAILMYLHLLLGAWTTIQQALNPAASDIIFFVTSPKVTAELKRRRARELLQDLALSHQNSQLPQLPLLARASVGQPRFFPTTPSECEQAISNCMPATRTDWWRDCLARLYFNTLLGDFLFLMELAPAIMAFINLKFEQRSELYGRFEREMESMDCYIWRQRAEALNASTALRVAEMAPHWTLFAIFDGPAMGALASLTVALLMNYYWCLLQDLAGWLAEFRMLMVATLMATRFQHWRDLRQLKRKLSLCDSQIQVPVRPPKWLDNGHEHLLSAQMGQHFFVDTRHFYKLPILREQFQDSIILLGAWLFQCFKPLDKRYCNATGGGCGGGLSTRIKESGRWRRFRWHHMNSKHSDRDYSDRFLAQILFPLSEEHKRSGLPPEHFDQTHYDLDTMAQIYVNARLLCEHVSQQPTKLAISITYLLNYGLVLICVLCQRQFSSLKMETMCVMVFVCVVANFLILLTCDFHAQAKKLQPLFWSLIAQLTLSEDPRVQHMRSLWLKLARHLDDQGGLALKAFGMKVSYIFIIQLLIWTATLLSLALKPRAFLL